MKIFTLLLLPVFLLFAQNESLPFSKINKKDAQKLECVFSELLEIQDMRANLRDLSISSAKEVLFYMEKEKDVKPIDNFAKALILDYMYRSEEAQNYYKKSIPLIEESASVKYDIAFFFARNRNVDGAVSLLSKHSNILEELLVSQLQAFVYFSNHLKVPSLVLSRCKKRGVNLTNLKKMYHNCKK